MTTHTILPGEVARCADITIGLVGLVEHLGNARHQVAPGSKADVNLQHALKSLVFAHAALSATAMLDAVAAHDEPNKAPVDHSISPCRPGFTHQVGDYPGANTCMYCGIKLISTPSPVTKRDGLPH